MSGPESSLNHIYVYTSRSGSPPVAASPSYAPHAPLQSNLHPAWSALKIGTPFSGSLCSGPFQALTINEHMFGAERH